MGIVWVNLSALLLSGCAPLLVGAGAVGGYALSRDSVIDYVDNSKEAVYEEALTVAKKMGEVALEAPKQGVIQARIEQADVKITVRQLTPQTVELRVRARNKFLMPKVNVAQRVYARIKERL